VRDMIDQTTIGTILLCLSTNGETESLTWDDFEQAMNLWVEEKSHRVDVLINSALDDVFEGGC
jgi:hypothetical protein